MEKSAEAFRTISEVSVLLDTPAHVLRFWESRFSQVKPVKRAGGRRYYRPSDLALLDGIRKLLHDDGMTIRGVQKILRENGIRHVAALSAVDLGGGDGGAAEPREPAAKAPDAATDASDAPATIHPWPASPSQEPAAASSPLQPDPDYPSKPVGVADSPFATERPFGKAPTPAGRRTDAPEAPMEVDVPTLPLGGADNVHSLADPAPRRAEDAARPAEPADVGQGGPDESDIPQPAAALLRAMDTLRAREKKSELKSVYLRLNDLRDRVARGLRNGRD